MGRGLQNKDERARLSASSFRPPGNRLRGGTYKVVKRPARATVGEAGTVAFQQKGGKNDQEITGPYPKVPRHGGRYRSAPRAHQNKVEPQTTSEAPRRTKRGCGFATRPRFAQLRRLAQFIIARKYGDSL